MSVGHHKRHWLFETKRVRDFAPSTRRRREQYAGVTLQYMPRVSHRLHTIYFDICLVKIGTHTLMKSEHAASSWDEM